MEFTAHNQIHPKRPPLQNRGANARSTVLLVSAKPATVQAVRTHLPADGFRVVDVVGTAGARERLRERVDVVLLDQQLPDTDLVGLVDAARTERAKAPLILLGTDDPHVDFNRVKQNVLPFDRKSRGLDALPGFLRKVLTTEMLRRRLRAVQDEDPTTRALIGDSPAMQAVKALVKRVAISRASTVLLQGETGTGKDLCAEILHNLSDRAAKPFLVITCSALPEHLLESELFGHERGAFTDARERKLGLFELAKGGTVFLDEIGEMTIPLQAKLLRFLEHKAFRRVGGLQDIEVDVRIVAATHRNLQERVRRGEFREDLFYRLNVMPIQLPPLRDRRDDILLLAQHFVDRYTVEFARRIHGLTPDAMACLTAHNWPGNVRELRNTIERAIHLTDDEWLRSGDLSISLLVEKVAFTLPAAGVRLDAVERELLEQALARVGGHQARAAELLGINRDQVRYRMRKYGIAKPRRRWKKLSPAG